MNQELVIKIKACKSMTELDSLRLEVVKEMTILGAGDYKELQDIFRKQKNKLLRIPRKDRLD
mgnify:CR=1 FL=1